MKKVRPHMQDAFDIFLVFIASLGALSIFLVWHYVLSSMWSNSSLDFNDIIRNNIYLIISLVVLSCVMFKVSPSGKSIFSNTNKLILTAMLTLWAYINLYSLSHICTGFNAIVFNALENILIGITVFLFLLIVLQIFRK